MNKPKPKTLDERASNLSARYTRDRTPNGWNEDNRIGYSWGAYDGYKAGFKAGRRGRK